MSARHDTGFLPSTQTERLQDFGNSYRNSTNYDRSPQFSLPFLWVWGLGFRVWGLLFRGLGFGVQGLGLFCG